MNNESLRTIYENHHKHNRPQDFSILEETRGEMIKKLVGQNKKVLDVGCRNGILTRYFSSNNIVTGVDIDSEALKEIKNKLNIETIEMDLNGNWHQLGGERYDFVVMGEVLEHLYNPSNVLEKVIKVLKPGGSLIGSVPNAFSLKNRLRYLFGSKINTPLADPTHINQFSYNDLKNLMTENFSYYEIIGLGRYEKLSKIFPNLIAFDFLFIGINLKR